MSLYLDTSVLLKLIFLEPQTPSVLNHVQQESAIIVSSLARLEAKTGIHARRQSGLIRPANAAKRLTLLDEMIGMEPFVFSEPPSNIFTIAENQLSSSYCPTLDRLHLAIMESLGVQRILTGDILQAKAAKKLGYEVLMIKDK